MTIEIDCTTPEKLDAFAKKVLETCDVEKAALACGGEYKFKSDSLKELASQIYTTAAVVEPRQKAENFIGNLVEMYERSCFFIRSEGLKSNLSSANDAVDTLGSFLDIINRKVVSGELKLNLSADEKEKFSKANDVWQKWCE